MAFYLENCVLAPNDASLSPCAEGGAEMRNKDEKK